MPGFVPVCCLPAALALSVVFAGMCGGCTRGKQAGESGASSEAKAVAPAERVALDAPAREGKPAKAHDTSQDALQEAWQAGRLPKSVVAGVPRQGGELTVGLFVEPPSMNGLVHADYMTSRLGALVYDRLVAEDPYDDPHYRPRPQLAERWTVSADGLNYTFYLRRGVTWHDGKPFGADDVVATFAKLLDDKGRTASMRTYFSELLAVDRVDDFTVRLRWKQPYFMVLDVLDDLPIMPAHIIGPLSAVDFADAGKNPLMRHPVGTGPFRFVRWQAGQAMLLERNDAYWGRKAYLDRLRFLFVEDEIRRGQLASHGDLDVWERPSVEQWADDDPFIRQNFNRSLFFDATWSWIGWNARRPFFADRRVRAAIGMLLDRKALARNVHRGLVKPATCHFYWASPICEGAKVLPYDPGRADRLLREAGWVDHDGDGVRDKDGQAFHFTLSVPSPAAPALLVLQEELRRHGIDMAIRQVDWSVYLRRLRQGAFDAYWLQWVSDANVDPTELWHSRSRTAGSNFLGFHDAEADRLIETARVTLDAEARNRAFRRLDEILFREQPVTLLFIPARLSLLHRRVRGAHANMLWWQFQDFWVDGKRTTR